MPIIFVTLFNTNNRILHFQFQFLQKKTFSLAAVTQMEPTDARRVAPCFDEPAFKAVWRLRVIHPTGSSAVSNAKEIKENEPTTDSDWVMTNFEETLPMSSYLLAVVVSDFEYVEGHTKNNVRVSKLTNFIIYSKKFHKQIFIILVPYLGPQRSFELHSICLGSRD